MSPVLNFLAISGGAEDGAFGAGLLVGWGDAGTRPAFDLVTGVSSGALIAPFIFLGRERDGQLREIFTKYGRKDIYTYNVNGLIDGSASDRRHAVGAFDRKIRRRCLFAGSRQGADQGSNPADRHHQSRYAKACLVGHGPDRDEQQSRCDSLCSERYSWRRRRFPGCFRRSGFRCGLAERTMTSSMSMAV